ncbi:MAG: type VI secretion protein IcmF/TssM N-terminal domain-containing protein [Desulfobacteraceae bacterium]|jgi:type VI secretion system protein ImpL
MKIFWQILKVTLLLLVALCLITLVFWLILSAGWPMWVGFFILLGLIGLVLCFAFARRYLLRWREQRFVQQIIEQDETYNNSLPEKDKGGTKDLQIKWKEAVAALKKSHLKQYGNPLYILPWYVVLGESGSGKTTALQSARLSSPFAEVKRVSGISGTRNCDWWFLEKAVILDTAGRYAIPVDEGRDKDEWQKFLRLLTRFRRKEPINGLVITMAADKLASAGEKELEEDARNIRRRVDELMLSLGAKFPIYVLVTKCDLVQGMARFCDNLSEETLNQAMGVINHDLSTDVLSVTKNTISQLAKRLRDLRLLVFHKSKSAEPDPGLLLFPEELERLHPGLETFMKTAFQANPYQETPLLRGIFFSSGRQEGSPYSHFLKELGLIHEREVLKGTSKGFFLHDFFSWILPADRHLFTPTLGLTQWRKLTQNIGLTAWLAVAVAICGLLSFSFAKNMVLMRKFSQDMIKPVVLQNDLASDVIRLDQFRETLLEVEKQNRGWWIPRFGLSESIQVEKALKDRYSKQFYDGFLSRYNKETTAVISGFTAETSSETIGAFTGQLVRRVNMIKGRLENENQEALKAMPLPSYEQTLKTMGHNIIPEISQKIAGMYQSYVLWNQDSNTLNQEMIQIQTLLTHTLTLKNANLNWMTTLVNNTPGLSPLTLEDFWGGSLAVPDEKKVEPAFTTQGMNTLHSFIKEMEEALTDPLIITDKKIRFESWYRKEYFNAWHVFGTSFHQGTERLNGITEWRQVASTMGDDQNPYFLLLDRITEEMKPYSEGADLPSWIKCVYDFEETLTRAAPLKSKNEKDGIIRKAASTVGSTLGKLENKTGSDPSSLESKIASAQALRDYLDALAKLSLVVASNDTAFQIATAIYNEDPATSQTPYFEARRSFEQLQVTMTVSGPAQELFWDLDRGPMNFLLAFISREAACHLQDIWEKDVLMEVQGETNINILVQDLLGKDGYARKFISGPAKPFIASGIKKGFHAKTIDGKSVPFDNFFFTFLNMGSQSVRPAHSSYTVTIHGEPTSVNKEASVVPHATELEMQCSDKTYHMANLNYPVREKVSWSPQACGEATFKIKVADTILTKRYSGDKAFAAFLKDFEKGARTFYPSEFPNEEAELKRLGINSIIARYRFEGHKPVIRFLQSSPDRVPEEIVKCWDQ